eukprot:NODE_897_length_1388_cov_62.257655_g748_i0.p1 GENE.NODE_897_length_1388_cov_62.257655_g748_i0~~NODE_897_length_1388_cov_62.257655_g748_i0.p1  ORF type:complete len:180 (-),score=50.15 NODE_897_length_1388_cov_62.257655_g748_i0:42-581(-)
MFQNIKDRNVTFSKYFTGPVMELCDRLMKVDPAERIGSGPDGFAEIKGHAFFSGVNWETIHETNNLTLENRNYTKDWKDYLLEGESVVFTSQVIKKRHFSTKKRQLILTSHPRLFYVDLDNNAVKGHVKWSDTMWAEGVNQTQFNVHTPERKWNFECFFEHEGQTSDLWVRKINSLLKQ